MNESDILEQALNNINKKVVFGDNPFFYANLAIAYAFTEEDEDHIQYSISIVNDIFKTNYTIDDSDKVISFLQKELMNYKNWYCRYFQNNSIDFSFLGDGELGCFDEIMNTIDLHIRLDSNNNIIDYEITY